VQTYENEAATDYRLNYRLKKECREDIDNLCSDMCDVDEGQVSACERA
jgi:Golgi apparatus protein 1